MVCYWKRSRDVELIVPNKTHFPVRDGCLDFERIYGKIPSQIHLEGGDLVWLEIQKD